MLRILVAIIVSTLLSLTFLRTLEAADFDHMTCQYPTRQSNPADGCDNSDPATPEEAKGALITPLPKVDLQPIKQVKKCIIE